MKKFLILLLFLAFAVSHAQEINQFDTDGKRHGKWMKTFDGTDQIRYQGTFEHGKEIGTFEFYKLPEENETDRKSYLFATKTYSENSELVEINYFSNKKDLLSKGKMKDQDRIGEWVYYHPGTDKILMTEYYENGKLNGEQTTYFLRGNVLKKSNFKNGILEGEKHVYTENGVLVKYFNGIVKYFDGEGNLTATGTYKNNQKNGEWKTYENGKLVKTEKYPLHKK